LQVSEWVEVYYERLLELANSLQVKAIDVFLTIIFKASLQPYLRLTITSMARDTFIKHKEVAMIYEESGPIITNYNVLITQLESKLIAQPIIIYIIIKQHLTSSNCGKLVMPKKPITTRK
jgi:hypothetical protein